MIETGIPIEAFMGGIAVGLASFFIACVPLLAAAAIRHLASAPFDDR